MKPSVSKLVSLILVVFLFTGLLGTSTAGNVLDCDIQDRQVGIFDWYDLDGIRNDLAGDYVLMNDIHEDSPGYHELAGPGANGGAGWAPIGNNNNLFTGTFHGGNHTIKGLFINRISGEYFGLFGATGPGAEISTVGLLDVDIDAPMYVGALTGYNTGGTIRNTHSSGTVSGNRRIGGLVGQNSGGTMVDTFSTVEVTGNYRVGGLVGKNDAGSLLQRSYATGNVTGGEDYHGGLVGRSTFGSTIIEDCYATGRVDGYRYVGGLVGSSFSGTVRRTYSTGSVNGVYSVGGLIGWHGGTTTLSYWDTQTSGMSSSAAGAGRTTAQMQDIDNYLPGWDIVVMEDWDGHVWHIDQGEDYPRLGEPPSQLPQVITLDATDITHEAAVLRGELISMGPEGEIDSVEVLFRYRESGGGDWNETEKHALNETGEFQQVVTGLRAATEHEFKAVVQWDSEEDLGSILTFTTDPGPVSRVEVEPEIFPEIPAGTDLNFTARAYDEWDNLITDHVSEFQWYGATLGVFNQEEVGEYNVSASYHDVHSDNVTVTVIPGAPYRLEVSPDEATVTAGDEQVFTAVAFDEFGNSMGEVTAVWSIQEGAGGSWDDNRYTSEFAGIWNVTGEYMGLQDVAVLTVEPGDAHSLAVLPATATVIMGEDVTYTAFTQDEFGNVLDDVTEDTQWSIEAGAGGTWDENVYTTENPGTWTVTGDHEGISGTAMLNVLDPADVAYISISPQDSTIPAGASQAYTATAYNMFDDLIGDVTGDTLWWIEDDAGGSWDDNVYTSQNAGNWTVTGTYMGHSDNATLLVADSGEISYIVLIPADHTITAGDTQAYSATGYDAFGNLVEDVTGETDWHTSGAAGGYWVANVYHSQRSGVWTVRGTYDGMENTTTLTVEPGPVYELQIHPHESSVLEGYSREYTALAVDDLGNEIGDVSQDTIWSIEAGAGGSWVDNVYTSENPGTWDVTGSYGGMNGTAILTVLDISHVSYIVVTPTDSTVTAGETQEFFATAYDDLGVEICDVTVDTAWGIDAGAGGSWLANTYTTELTGLWTVTGTFAGMDGTASLRVNPGVVDRVVITPDGEVTVTAGEDLQFTAEAYDAFDNIITDTPTDFTWSGAGASGTFNQHIVGTYQVSASYDTVSSIQTTINVVPGSVHTVTISPSDTVSVEAGTDIQFSAEARDVHENLISDTPASFSWSGTSGTGVFNRELAGIYIVNASYGGVVSPDTEVTVVPGVVNRVIITPADEVTVTAGADLPFTSQALDIYENVITDNPEYFTWSGTDMEGMFNQEIAGTYHVTATYEGITSPVTIVRVEPAVVSSVVINPDTDQTVAQGESIQFSAAANDRFGNLITDDASEFQWQNTDEAGLFRQDLPGEYQVTATFMGIRSDPTVVTVEPPPDPEPFFTVEITGHDEEVFIGETVTVEYNITNTGGAFGVQDILFRVDGMEMDIRSELSLEPGESHNGTFSWLTMNEGTFVMDVSSFDHNHSVRVTVAPVPPGPHFEVEITDHDREVKEGETVTIRYRVINTGELQGTQDILFRVNGQQRDSLSVSLEPGQEMNHTFQWIAGEEGEYELRVSSHDTEGSVNVTVTSEEKPDDPDDSIMDTLRGYCWHIILIIIIIVILILLLKRRDKKEKVPVVEEEEEDEELLDFDFEYEWEDSQGTDEDLFPDDELLSDEDFPDDKEIEDLLGSD